MWVVFTLHVSIQSKVIFWNTCKYWGLEKTEHVEGCLEADHWPCHMLVLAALSPYFSVL